jgi:hypothetical protein
MLLVLHSLETASHIDYHSGAPPIVVCRKDSKSNGDNAEGEQNMPRYGERMITF